METSRLEEIVYSALKSDTELMELLRNGESSIFHLQAPECYPDLIPILVYSPISDTPALFGDNQELAHRVIIRIHIITGKIDYYLPYERIRKIMAGIGFTRGDAYPFIDEKGVRMLITNFEIKTRSEE